MIKYLFLIFFIISNVYINGYELAYTSEFTSCDGIEEVVRENNPVYVTDVKISPDSSDVYKRVLFAYHEAHGDSVENKRDLEYYALLLKIKTEQKSDDSGKIVNVETVDWRNSLLSKIYLSGDINEYIKSNYGVYECTKNYINKRNNSIRDVLTLSGLRFKKQYRMDSFMTIMNRKLAEPVTIRKQTRDILTIDNSPQFVKKLWDDIINSHRKIFLRSDYIPQMIIFNYSLENEIFAVFNSPSYSYTPEEIEHGISREKLSKNRYIVMKLKDKKLFYMCALDLSKVESLPLLTERLACFKVTTNKTEGVIHSLDEVTFTQTKISHNRFPLTRAYITPFGQDLKARYLGNHMIELIGPNLKFDLRLVYFLKLGYDYDLPVVAATDYITVYYEFIDLEDNLIIKLKELKELNELNDIKELNELKEFPKDDKS